MASQHKNPGLLEQAKGLNNVPWCEDYEQMISGMLYDSFTTDLMESRQRARRLCMQYNTFMPATGTMEEVRQLREEMLRELLGSVGPKVFIEPPFFVDYGCNITLGKEFYANFNTVILDCSLVTIGDRVMFGPGVQILAATHETEIQSRREGIEFAREVSIGSDCWIGGNVIILPGVKIGKGCTIGAGSTVTKDIPDFSVAVGAPARVIKKVMPVPDIEP